MKDHLPLVCYSFACRWHQSTWWFHHWYVLIGICAAVTAIGYVLGRWAR